MDFQISDGILKTVAPYRDVTDPSDKLTIAKLAICGTYDTMHELRTQETWYMWLPL